MAMGSEYVYRRPQRREIGGRLALGVGAIVAGSVGIGLLYYFSKKPSGDGGGSSTTDTTSGCGSGLVPVGNACCLADLSCPSGYEGQCPDCTPKPGTPTVRQQYVIEFDNDYSGSNMQQVRMYFDHRVKVVSISGILGVHVDVKSAVGISSPADVGWAMYLENGMDSTQVGGGAVPSAGWICVGPAAGGDSWEFSMQTGGFGGAVLANAITFNVSDGYCPLAILGGWHGLSRITRTTVRLTVEDAN